MVGGVRVRRHMNVGMWGAVKQLANCNQRKIRLMTLKKAYQCTVMVETGSTCPALGTMPRSGGLPPPTAFPPPAAVHHWPIPCNTSRIVIC